MNSGSGDTDRLHPSIRTLTLQSDTMADTTWCPSCRSTGTETTSSPAKTSDMNIQTCWMPVSPVVILFVVRGSVYQTFPFFTPIFRSEAGGIHASLSGRAAGSMAMAAAHRGLRGDRVGGHGCCSPHGKKTTPPAACGEVESCPPWKTSPSLGQRWGQKELSNSHLKTLCCNKTELKNTELHFSDPVIFNNSKKKKIMWEMLHFNTCNNL